eukprot:TRINITY_DN469_c0_g1_i2.p1 TRINITY_DN469_c0_g1~~TRINITY_DN469_c0_g1_i2.p1  ORF type:complete len:113 (-),score=12.86 TRINITY_DN469_c0_g1_i2:132-470(-)
MLLKSRFPDYDYSLIQKDVWWFFPYQDFPDECNNDEGLFSVEDVRRIFKERGFYEREFLVEDRINQFSQYLQDLDAKNILVVGHCDYFHQITNVWLDNCECLTIANGSASIL